MYCYADQYSAAYASLYHTHDDTLVMVFCNEEQEALKPSPTSAVLVVATMTSESTDLCFPRTGVGDWEGVERAAK